MNSDFMPEDLISNTAWDLLCSSPQSIMRSREGDIAIQLSKLSSFLTKQLAVILGAPDTDLVDKFNYNSYGAQNSGLPPLPSPPSLRSGGPPGWEVVSGHPKASFALILIGGSPLPNLNP
ncbi:hypothetical protein BT96DRAFT_950324 [Gymnopus androsaceus JB14]|uniref:Uncharacterized protein n=1 Tax=Gymnopus androsaceus JB14 TaxID=1447944 RepID=A0A6A4GGZ1_9AGAR|nr:hypothetical protein BT96DRAFT_950324 [Gymnopus androsaceus JB14]